MLESPSPFKHEMILITERTMVISIDSLMFREEAYNVALIELELEMTFHIWAIDHLLRN